MKCEATANDSVVIFTKKHYKLQVGMVYKFCFLQCTLTPGLLIFTKFVI